MIGGHGGNIYRLAHQLECQPADISDMSANVNPLGPMPALIDYLGTRLSAIAVLPEVDAGRMIGAFSHCYDLDPRQVMAGNGTTELIYLIPRALGAKKALVIGPTYADYQDACTMNRVACDHFICRESDHFIPDFAAIRQKAAAVDLVFICNPNNPTGVLVDRSVLHDLCRALPDTVFVIDESYLPFAPIPEEVSLIASNLPNVLVLNSMSKAFRIPGLRIGFVKGALDLIVQLRRYALPWSVNSLAQEAVQWLMTHPEPVNRFLASTRETIDEEKSRFEEWIHKESVIQCFPSATSFILMRLPEGLSAQTAWRHMAARRILIRDCGNFVGLSETFIRISLKSSRENRRAVEQLIRLAHNPVDTEGEHER
ncbi:MAG: threonine-phosphate decarboxylase [Desulfosarcina sp.]